LLIDIIKAPIFLPDFCQSCQKRRKFKFLQIAMRIRIALYVLLCLSAHHVLAASDTLKIPIQRQYFHDKVDAEQRLCDKLDGREDSLMVLTDDALINREVSDRLYRKVNELQENIERNPRVPASSDKIRQLTGLENTLRQFRLQWKARAVSPALFPDLIACLDTLLIAGDMNTSIEPFVRTLPLSLADILVRSFPENPGWKDAQRYLYFQQSVLYPDKIMSTIRSFKDEPFADSLIVRAARHNPSLVFTYAQSPGSPEGSLIHKNKHPLVKTLVILTELDNGLMYFPFLDEILSGKKSIPQLKKVIGDGERQYDSVTYYKWLVQTEIAYFSRLSSLQRDTPVAMFGPNGLRQALKERAIRHFIKPINELHDQNNLNVRMKAIDSLNPAELYFMIVMGEQEIFTSSYKHSFNRMLQRMGTNIKPDSLLLQVHFDYFRKFIKMASNYNKLDTFLKAMPPAYSEKLMRAFVANLDGPDNLEDATDVADAYSSISQPALQQKILQYVEENKWRCTAENNESGRLIYSLLKHIFLSADTTQQIDLQQLTGIPPVSEIAISSLQDNQGRVVQQVFFYGDEDGLSIFPAFLNSFPAAEWTTVKKPEWVEIKSKKGNIWVFANLPLDYNNNLDDSAQAHLIEYMTETGLTPTVVIHRGHSYWLPGTIRRMASSARLVLLGSCGGYKNLNQILRIAPEAHIISTKEIGAGDINRPIINYMNSAFLNGKNIRWKEMWKRLTLQFQAEKNRTLLESWESYVPPYKNLGAIFLMAYNKRTSNLQQLFVE